MKVVIKITKNFERQAKPLLKKYSSLKNELFDLQELLKRNPKYGISLGDNLFEIKLRVKSKGKGKSGGLRLITFVDSEVLSFVEYSEDIITIYLVQIYDKSETATISNNELKKFIRNINKLGY